MNDLEHSQDASAPAIEVRLYGGLRLATGAKTLNIPAGASLCMGDLFARLVEMHPSLRPELLDAQGRLHEHIHLILNGENVSYQAELEQVQLSPGDVLRLIPAIDGGGG